MKQHSVDLRGGYYRVTKKFMSNFPVPLFRFDTEIPERLRFAEKGRKLYDRFCQKNDFACVLGFVEHHLLQEPQRVDVVHDLLAFLAEQMITMSKEKQQDVEDFWLDLEGVTDPDTFDTLRHRGKWESSLWKAEACRPFVAEDSRSTRHLDQSLGWNEDCFKAFIKMLAGKVDNLSALVRVYRKHHPHYAALHGRLAATDYLIDQIVYQLYGLTEEEIAIVEGET